MLGEYETRNPTNIGIVFVDLRLFTRWLGYLAGLSFSVYLAVVLGLTAIYGLAVRSMVRKHRFEPKRFPQVLLESAVYALLMGPVAGKLLSQLHVLGGCLARMGILDRIVGYQLSPLLWKKVRRGLSAGRVQSVAVRVIAEREREIGAFRKEEYWKIVCRVRGCAVCSARGPPAAGSAAFIVSRSSAS